MEDSSKQKDDRMATEPTTKPATNAVPEKVVRAHEQHAQSMSCECPPGCVGLSCCA
jgi:hypothetical protein